MNFNKRLKALRQGQGWTVKSTAEKFGVPETTYREWKYGRAIQGEEEPYPKIASLFNLSLFELITGKKPDQNKIFRELELLEEKVKNIKKDLMSFF